MKVIEKYIFDQKLNVLKIKLIMKINGEQIFKLFYETKNKSRKWKKYFSIYEENFREFKEKDITFVEIGIHNGGSLEIWKKYFSKRSRIIGIDINEDCKKFEKDGIEVFIGNQSDPIFWKNFFSKIGNVDIILDDGGHTNLDQITTGVSVIKHINDGGIFLVEDTHTSYLSEYNSNPKTSFVEFSKKNVDDLNSKYSKEFKQFNFSLSNYVYKIIFYESIIVYKIDRTKTGFNELYENYGTDNKIQDLTWKGNEINIKKYKNFLLLISKFISINKFTKFIKKKINNRIIKKYFK